jgi:polygalacturonase
MSHQISRRSLLRMSALAGAGAAAVPLLAGRAGAVTNPAARPGRRGPRVPVDEAADRIIASVRRPRFPRRAFPVNRFGAVGDGTTKNTSAFRAAIKAANRAGGGQVLVPAGSFLTGAIHLLSNVDLHL